MPGLPRGFVGFQSFPWDCPGGKLRQIGIRSCLARAGREHEKAPHSNRFAHAALRGGVGLITIPPQLRIENGAQRPAVRMPSGPPWTLIWPVTFRLLPSKLTMA